MTIQIYLLVVSLLISTYHLTGVTSLYDMCTDHERGKLRLMNGTNRYEGRVEICQRFNHYQYVWWSLCSDEWDAREAAVVCKQLGYLENYAQNAIAMNSNYFGRGNGPMYPVAFHCNGTEDRLGDCISLACRLPWTAPGVLCPVIITSTIPPVSSTARATTVLPSSTTRTNQSDATSISEMIADFVSVSSQATNDVITTPTKPTASNTFSTFSTISLQMSSFSETFESMSYSTEGPSSSTQTTLSVKELRLPTQTPGIPPILTFFETGYTSSYNFLSTSATTQTGPVRSVQVPGPTVVNPFTSIENALLLCSLIAVVLFIIIICLVIITVLLTIRGRKQKQKQERRPFRTDNPVYDNNTNMGHNEEVEHNLENPLYGDTTLLASPTVTRNTFFPLEDQSNNDIIRTTNQPKTDLNQNDYETIKDRTFTQDSHTNSSQPARRSRMAKVKIPILKKQDQVYDSLSKQVVSRRSSGDYSNLDSSQHADYAILEPYIPCSTNDGGRTGRLDEGDYSHLDH